MPVSDVVLLIGAVTSAIGAAGLIIAPIVVALINRGKVKPEKVTQGQHVPPDHLGTLIADLTENRDYWRRRAELAEDRNRALADHEPPTGGR